MGWREGALGVRECPDTLTALTDKEEIEPHPKL